MIVGFILDKINVSKNKEIKGDIEAQNNVKITNITEQNITSLSAKGSGLDIAFSFEVKFGKDLASINFEGKALYMVEEKEKKEMLDDWKKDKKVDPKRSQPILNSILQKCNIKALSLTEEVGLPPHIPFPRLALKSQVEGEKQAA